MHRRVGALSQRVGVLTVTHRAVRQRDGALREGLVMGVVLSMRRGSVFNSLELSGIGLGVLSSQLGEIGE